MALLLAAGLALRLWFVLRNAEIGGDTLVYGDFASNWLQHGIYGFTRTIHGLQVIRPTLIRLPGYPLFLAVCFRLFGVGRYTPVLLVQALVDLLGCWLLALLARRLAGPAALVPALALAALCPFTAAYTAAPLTETLTLFSIDLAFYALTRWQARGQGLNRWLYLLAAALAYSILLRPEQGLLAAAVVAAVLWLSLRQTRPSAGANRLARLRPALVLSLLTVLPLVPWTLRNERTFHVLQPLAPRYATDPGELVNYGFQRWYRTFALDYATSETVYWNYDGAPIAIQDLPSRAFTSTAQYDATAQLLDDYNRTPVATHALDARFDAIAQQSVTADPLRYYLLLPVGRVLNMIFRPRAELSSLPLEWWRFHRHPLATIVALGFIGLNLLYILLAAAGFLRRRLAFPRYGTHAPILWAMLATILFRCLILLQMDNSEPRYTLEFYPVLIVFGAAWLARSSQQTGRLPHTGRLS